MKNIQSFKTYRFASNPLERILHNSFIEEFSSFGDLDENLLSGVIFGWSDDYQSIPNSHLTEREIKIVLSSIQWLGSPVGQNFLSGVKDDYKKVQED